MTRTFCDRCSIEITGAPKAALLWGSTGVVRIDGGISTVSTIFPGPPGNKILCVDCTALVLVFAAGDATPAVKRKP